MSSSYLSLLRHPLWIKRQAQILERDDFTCTCGCGRRHDLEVHHTRYIRGLQPWNYPDHLLKTLSADCHLRQTKKQKRKKAWRFKYVLRRARRYIRRRT